MLMLLVLALLSAALVGVYRRLALHRNWLDTPNQRSSHQTITPRGAGIVFASIIIVTAIWQLRSHSAFLPTLFAGGVVALTGWWDDLRGVSVRTRFILYLIASITAVVPIVIHASSNSSNALSHSALLIYASIATFGLIWLINLYNFMDGINGIAATEALFVLLATAIFASDTPYALTFIPLHGYSVAAIVGFLLWNFPAGKVFMGDAGSAFLGFFLGVLLLWSTFLQGPSPAIWLILLGGFIVDSSYTLLVRIATGQQWYAAHRLHAYQRLTDRLHGSHSGTVCLFMAVNVCWLLPMAWLVHTQQLPALSGLALSYIPLIVGCYWLKAGIKVSGAV